MGASHGVRPLPPPRRGDACVARLSDQPLTAVADRGIFALLLRAPGIAMSSERPRILFVSMPDSARVA
jgi:hypothetical protein